MRIKPGEQGARIYGIRPEVVLGLFIIEQVFKEAGCQIVLTAGCDGKHHGSSLHYLGLAVDIRLNDISISKHADLLVKCKEVLGDDFDVLIENSGTTLCHMHVEFQPKRGPNMALGKV